MVNPHPSERLLPGHREKLHQCQPGGPKQRETIAQKAAIRVYGLCGEVLQPLGTSVTPTAAHLSSPTVLGVQRKVAIPASQTPNFVLTGTQKALSLPLKWIRWGSRQPKMPIEPKDCFYPAKGILPGGLVHPPHHPHCSSVSSLFLSQAFGREHPLGLRIEQLFFVPLCLSGAGDSSSSQISPLVTGSKTQPKSFLLSYFWRVRVVALKQ